MFIFFPIRITIIANSHNQTTYQRKGNLYGKKRLGETVALAAVSGAVAAGVSYVLQYKTYHKELEKDFREFEEDEDSELKKDGSEDSTFESAKVNRNYISLTSSKDEFKVAAKDMAQATKNVLRDAGSLFSDTAHEAVSARCGHRTYSTEFHEVKKRGMEGGA